MDTTPMPADRRAALGQPTELASAAIEARKGNIGEVETLVDKLSLSVNSAEQEFDELVARLQNVISQEPRPPEPNTTKDQLPSSTQLGNSLAITIDRVERLASNIRIVREALGN